MQVMARPIERKEIVVGWASPTVLVTLVTINGVYVRRNTQEADPVNLKPGAD
jgi:hypothetical protein